MPILFAKWNDWLSKNMFIVVLSGLLLGLFINITDSPSLRKIVVALFAYMTFVTALGTSFKEFTKVLYKPWIPLWVLILVHFVTPLTAYTVGMIFYPNDPDIRLGYLIGSSIPIGVTSIIWTSLIKGDLAISFVAVTLDTFVVPVALPLFFHIFIGQTIDINYRQMVIDLMLMVTIPSITGMLLHDQTQGKTLGFAKSLGGATSKLCLFFVILINSAVVMPQITWDISILKTLMVTLFIVSAGFFVGYLGSFAVKERTQGIILTMMYNVGIRNNACGLVIALTYFPPRVAIPMTLSILYQQPLATIIAHLYKRLKTI
ncbi:MAG: Bile acid:sodium symporter [Firmicutes bacterium]|nr:Bile acid:sodium symporter [Bacillota bacterium]